MSLLEIIRQARRHLEESGRLSYRMLRREFDLDDDTLAEVIEELVDIQRVARREENALVWSADAMPGRVEAEAAPSPPARNPRAYTPKHLADKILQSKSALEGERKQVTVLFADVKGSMELAEQLDPEEWHKILDRFFQILTDGVHRFEGTVNQYTGDGIMALFGAPIAHEDHAQRACYAALHLRDEIARYATEVKREHGIGFSARMGLNSGEVVVGKIGDDLRMDYTAQGHTVGLAQRMEALASPDSCYVTAATAALAGGYFALEDLGDFRIKGVAEPMRVHRLTGAGASLTRFDVARARGLTRFVGRAADMRVLEDAVEQSAVGHGQVVGVVAEAGTGKSRLCFEFLERCRARGMRVFEGRAVAHGKNIPYLPILEVYRAFFGITFEDDDRSAREKIAGRMVLLDQKFADALPLLFDFLSVADPQHPTPRLDPGARQRQLLAVMRQVIQSVSENQPTVTLIEDLHWMDDASEEFVEHMVDARANSRNLLLLNFRPEYHADWMQKSWYRQIPLTPLGKEAIAELLVDLLGTDPSLAALAEPIHARTGGNPFFTEEVAQTLIESGHLEGERGAYKLVTPIDRLEVPATVQAVLAARIDRLPEREKQLLQVASVIGKDFAEPLLAAVAELPADDLKASLAALRKAEFLYEQAIYPVVEYSFKHPLTQEVALNSQLRQRRSRTHAAVAGAIEQLHADEIAEHSPLLAHHWEEAGQALPAARWHRRASQWVGRNDFVQGLRHTQRVLELARGLEPSDERDSLHLYACRNLLVLGGWSAGLSREVMDEILAEGVALATRAGDVSATVDLHTGYGIALGFAGDIRAYLEGARKAAALIDDSVSRDSASNVISASGYSSLCLGRHADALEFGEQARKLAEGDPSVGVDNTGFSAWGWSAWILAQTYTRIGRLDEARSLFLEALHITRTHDMREPLAWTLWLSSELADALGAAAPSRTAYEARRHALECLEIAEQHGSNLLRIMARRGLGLAHVLHEEWSEATEALEWSLATARAKQNNLECEAAMLADLSRAYLGRGETQRARTTAEEAIARAQKQGALYFQCMGRLALARALRADPGTGAPEEIEACLNRALALVHETGGHTLEPQILEERASLAALRGDHGKAAEELRRAHARYVEIGASEHAERLAAGDPSL